MPLRYSQNIYVSCIEILTKYIKWFQAPLSIAVQIIGNGVGELLFYSQNNDGSYEEYWIYITDCGRHAIGSIRFLAFGLHMHSIN